MEWSEDTPTEATHWNSYNVLQRNNGIAGESLLSVFIFPFYYVKTFSVGQIPFLTAQPHLGLMLHPAVALSALFFSLQDSLIISVVFLASHCCDASF